jgi:MFS family permease
MDRLTARFAFMLGLCCYFVASVLAVSVGPHAIWIAYAAAVLFETGFGWTFVCLNTTTAHFYEPMAFPKLNGRALLLTGICSSPAGVIGGKLLDVYGNYTLAFKLNMLIAAMGIVALWFAKRPAAPHAGIESQQIPT